MQPQIILIILTSKNYHAYTCFYTLQTLRYIPNITGSQSSVSLTQVFTGV